MLPTLFIVPPTTRLNVFRKLLALQTVAAVCDAIRERPDLLHMADIERLRDLVSFLIEWREANGDGD